MGKQSIIDKTDLTNFLDCGAIIQVASNQFKLIWGPFKQIRPDLDQLEDEKTIIYKPNFWDFTDSDLQSNAATFVGCHEAIFTLDELVVSLQQLPKPAVAKIQWQNVDDSKFKSQFEWSQQQFLSKTLLKTVPIISQVGMTQFSKNQLAQMLVHLISGKHYGTTYGFWENSIGFLGQTPELILEWSADLKKLTTMALAGTLPQSENCEQKILADLKIQDEHQIVVNDILNVLKLANPNKKIETKPLSVLHLKHLCHLQTSILIHDVEIKQANDYINKIHPTAALGLYPRNLNSYKQFKEFELQKQRGNFAAPFAFLNKQQIKAVAAIRLVYFNNQQLEIISGCGVTAASDLQSELQELQAKRNSVKKMMGLNTNE